MRLGFGFLSSRVGLSLLYLFSHVMSKSEKVEQELRIPGISLSGKHRRAESAYMMVARYGMELFLNKEKTAKTL